MAQPTTRIPSKHEMSSKIMVISPNDMWKVLVSRYHLFANAETTTLFTNLYVVVAKEDRPEAPMNSLNISFGGLNSSNAHSFIFWLWDKHLSTSRSCNQNKINSNKYKHSKLTIFNNNNK